MSTGLDSGAEHWATIASRVETAKLNGIDPPNVFTGIVAGHPQSQIDELLPWSYIAPPLKAVT